MFPLDFFKSLFNRNKALTGIPLYVVDMQTIYEASANIVEGVLHEIELAKERDDYVIFVEFGNGETLLRLKRAVEEYDKVGMLTKNDSDGSTQFISEMGKMKKPVKSVRVCGVNKSACVYHTVRGLIDHLPKSVKVELACDAVAEGGDVGWGNGTTIERTYRDMVSKRFTLVRQAGQGEVNNVV